MNTTVTIISLDEIRRTHTGHFFDKGATRFFRSRYPETAYKGPGGIYFVTSEQFIASDGQAWPRHYTVRTMATNGDIFTAGDFNKMTRAAAIGAAKRLAAGSHA